LVLATRAGTVVMRQGLPIEANGWQATIEVSDAAGPDAVPSLLWRRPGQPWQSTPGFALPDGHTTPGYVRYAVTIDVLEQPLEAIPYLPLAGGGRLFDHNRNPGGYDNYVIAAPDFAIWTAPTICAATTTLTFAADYTQKVSGPIIAGGQLHIDYATSRLHACPNAKLTAHLRFAPGDGSDPSVDSGSATVAVPVDDASRVTIWFDATNAAGCHAYDSAYGANYVFPVVP
jgi:Family of unknown function (DUF6209)